MFNMQKEPEKDNTYEECINTIRLLLGIVADQLDKDFIPNPETITRKETIEYTKELEISSYNTYLITGIIILIQSRISLKRKKQYKWN